MTKELIKEKVIEYLAKYDDSFTIVQINNSTAPGDDFDYYDIETASNKYGRKPFYVRAKVGNSNISIESDGYSEILVEQVYLDNLRFEVENEIFVANKVTLSDVINEEAIRNVTNVEDARIFLDTNVAIYWLDVILISGVDLDNDLESVENLVSGFCRTINENHGGMHKLNVYFYPKTIDRSLLQFNYSLSHSESYPLFNSVEHEWKIVWDSKKLDQVNHSFRELVQKRRNIYH